MVVRTPLSEKKSPFCGHMGEKGRNIYPKAEAQPHKDRDDAWVAQKNTIAGKRYTVALLNHPDNPTDTRFSADRDDGRFEGLFRTTIPAEGNVTLRARFPVAEGDTLSPKQIQKAANAFSGRDPPTPAVTELPAEGKPAKKDPASPKK